MLVQFSVKNYKLFKEKATISLVASNYDKDTRVAENIAVYDHFKLRLLKSAVIYGANASGKSKLMEALSFMRHFAINSSKESQKGDKIEVDPFRLNSETEHAPSEFEVVFIYKNEMYRYGFETDRNCIISEWLYHKSNIKEAEIFYREYQSFPKLAKKFSKGSKVTNLVRDNALLISVAAQFNDPIAINVIDWFKRLKSISGLNERGFRGFTMSMAESSTHKSIILDLLNAADLGIEDIKPQSIDRDQIPNDIPEDLKEKILNSKVFSDIITYRKKYDANKKTIDQAVDFSLEKDESSGTQKLFALTGPILDVIENGLILVVDELDAKLHPNLVCKIVSLFNSKETNKKNAQLIFNTHDTNLLSSELFRRDQIWFTQKDEYGEAQLYSLADFKSDTVRKSEAFESNYIRGKYGAVPYLEYFDELNERLERYGSEK